MASFVPLGCVATLSAGALAQVPPAEIVVEPLAGPVLLDKDASRTDWLMVVRVVDAITGAALTGARVHQVAEAEEPAGGRFHTDGTWSADEHGFVRVPRTGLRDSGWFFVEHDGYAPLAEMHYLAEVVGLAPGVDVPLRVVDPFDQPIAGARLGLCLGCGHTPDVRNATTGADGTASWPCVETAQRAGGEFDGSGIHDAYLHASGFGGPYSDVAWRLGDGPATLRPDFVPDVHGRVIGPNGTPVAGVALGGSLHRGPWTWSAADGSFRLVGRESRHDQLRIRAFGREHWLQPPRRERAIDVVLPVAECVARAHGRIAATVIDDATGRPIANAFVAAVLPGLVCPGDPTESGVTDANGACTVAVAAGLVDIHVEDSASPPAFDPDTRTSDVAAGRDTAVELRVRRRLLRTVTIAGEWNTLSLVTTDATTPVGDTVRAELPVPLPVHGRFALTLDEGRDTERRFVFVSAPVGPIELRAFAPTRVTARIVDEQGRAVAARVAVEQYGIVEPPDEAWTATDERGTAVVPTMRSGCTFLYVEPLGDASLLRPRAVHLTLPALGDGEVFALGDVVLRPRGRPQLRITNADGSAASGTLSALRPALSAGADLAADGGVDGLDLAIGDRLVFTPDAPRAAFSMVWTGHPVWTLPDDRATLRFEVVDQFGLRPAEATVLLGTRVVHEFQGQLVVEHVPAGDVELFVGGNGCHGARVLLHVHPGEQRAVPVALHRPPAQKHR